MGTHVEVELDPFGLAGHAGEGLVSAAPGVVSALVQDGAVGQVSLGRVWIHVLHLHHFGARHLAQSLARHFEGMLNRLPNLILCGKI